MRLVIERALKFDQQVLIFGTVDTEPGFQYEVVPTDSHASCALSCDSYDQYHRVD